MQIAITDKPEDALEASTYGDSMTIDIGGVDIRFEDGRIYSATWGDEFVSDVAERLILEEFKNSGEDDRKEIRDSLAELLEYLEDYDG